MLQHGGAEIGAPLQLGDPFVRFGVHGDLFQKLFRDGGTTNAASQSSGFRRMMRP